MLYYVIRNNRNFGPYDVSTLSSMVSEGSVLNCDKAAEENGVYEGLSVKDVLKRERKTVKPRHLSPLKQQFAKISKQVILPIDELKSHKWTQDTQLVLLAGIGLFPAVIGNLSYFSEFLSFYANSLYFSVVWALFFYYVFKTQQVTTKTTLTLFFATQILVFIAWDVLGLPNLNPFYHLDGSGFLLGKLVYFVLGVGLTEELAKALPLILILRRTKEPLIPQTMVFYGLVSGIAFGVFEGVQYQLQVNRELDYAASFMWNIARLTSLPFIHALWAATAGYFLSFAYLYPLYRRSLYILAILVPAVLHGVYDTACSYPVLGFFVRVPVMVFSVILLVTYLRRGRNLQTRLSNRGAA
ncbi:MAG: PrsW family intramembrane metalloprotease [Bacteroidales bacterium]|nr:PrsW family intramembrane metalloprotease [Bacteroidales bacterium]